MLDHDFVKFPELRNNQLADLEFSSPHPQLKEDFWATVVKVHDGDTVSLSVPDRDFVFPLRLAKINAPELSEGGHVARDWLKARLEGAEVYIKLSPERVEKWGRLLGSILHNGSDVADDMVFLGLATPYDLRHDGEIINPLEGYKWSVMSA